MIDLKALERSDLLPTGRTYADEYRMTLKNRKADPSQVDLALALNKDRKRLIADIESKKAEQNKVGTVIATKKRAKENADSELAEMQTLAGVIKELEGSVVEAEKRVFDLMAVLPNMLHPSVPVGASEADNVVVKAWGEPKSFSFKPKEHWEIDEKLGVIDFERAGKVAGARFAYLKGTGARLERALISFMLDMHTTQHGYTEMLPPFIVNYKSLFGTNQLPKFKEDLFHLTGFEYALIPTAEVPVTNYYADEVLDEDQLPISYAAYSPCFRSEAGSYGKDTRGLIRQHQFEKVELVKFANPATSYEEHETLTQNAEAVLMRLGLPFRRMALCSADIGFGAAKCYDIEVWLPGQNAFREISSCSIFEDFQARRANIRFKAKGGKPQFVHTINGSGLAIGRTLIAVLENYQHEDGTVQVPDALVPYMGGLKQIK